MARRPYRKLPPDVSSFWIYIRAVASGLVTNGHFILLVLLCFGAYFLARGLTGVAGDIEPVEPPQKVAQRQSDAKVSGDMKVAERTVEPPPPAAEEDARDFQAESDERVIGHLNCTYTEYRRAYPVECDALEKHVDGAGRPKKDIDKDE